MLAALDWDANAEVIIIKIMETTDNRSAEITAALLPAYQKATQERLSKSESKALMKLFPDSEIEIRPDGLIYIPHIFLSERLNQVIGPCQWMLQCRNPKYVEANKSMAGEFVLIIRGYAVGESAGEGKISEKNNKHGDAMEWARAEALRRITGKCLSCGSQVWKPDFIAKWIKKNAVKIPAMIWDEEKRDYVAGFEWKKKGAEVTTLDAENFRTSKPLATEDQKHVMLQCLTVQGVKNVMNYAVHEGILKEGQTLDDWPLEQVAVTESQIKALQAKVEAFYQPAPAKKPISWKDFPVPFSSLEGKLLGKLKKHDLESLWNDVSSPLLTKTYPEFRAALDEAGKAMKFKKTKAKK